VGVPWNPFKTPGNAPKNMYAESRHIAMLWMAFGCRNDVVQKEHQGPIPIAGVVSGCRQGEVRGGASNENELKSE